MISISVHEYYRAVHFKHMPPVIFDALEAAFKAGEEKASVPDQDFFKMITEIELKSGIKDN